MTEQEKELLIRYNAGLCTEAEKMAVEKWLFELNNEPINLSVERLASIKAEVRNSLPKPELKLKVISPLWKRVAVAASVVICCGVGFYLYKQDGKLQQDSQVVQNDIAPGKNGATLTLANGKKILINDALTGSIANESGVRISKTKDGRIIYEIVDDKSSTNAYNILTTTRGEQTQVRLPDGTLVFLNAESSLKYPASFARLAKREVVLSGEGYFEVVKDKAHPFTVESKGQKIEVLGTHFNINAYGDKGKILTTLLEGSVKVKVGDKFVILTPNEQAAQSASGISISDIDPDFVTSWHNGYFVFDNERLEDVMPRIARWYNIDYRFTDEDVKSNILIGTISRQKNLSEVLRGLERTDKVSFRKDGKFLLISSK